MTSVNHHDLLAVLLHCGPETPVKTLMDYLPEDADRSIISTKLCRMRDKGWLTAEMREGINYWTATTAGLAAINAIESPSAAVTASEPQAEPAPPLADDSELEPSPGFEMERPPDPIAEELMASMEIELALDAVRTALLAPALPARTRRVYLQIVDALPAVLRDVLAPLTTQVSEVRL